MQAGVKKGDVVALYLTVSPIAVATMLATARIGNNSWQCLLVAKTRTTRSNIIATRVITWHFYLSIQNKGTTSIKWLRIQHTVARYKKPKKYYLQQRGTYSPCLFYNFFKFDIFLCGDTSLHWIPPLHGGPRRFSRYVAVALRRVYRGRLDRGSNQGLTLRQGQDYCRELLAEQRLILVFWPLKFFPENR